MTTVPKGKRHDWQKKNLGLQHKLGMVAARTEELHRFTCAECGSTFDVFVGAGRTFRPTDRSVTVRGIDPDCRRSMLIGILES